MGEAAAAVLFSYPKGFLPPHRQLRVPESLLTPGTVVVTADTRSYHALAAGNARGKGLEVEWGSSYGDCTAVVAREGGVVRGVDISEECVAEARVRHPGVEFVLGDVLREGEAGAHTAGAAMLLVDINGNREVKDVVAAIAVAQQLGIPLTIVKSHKLHALGRRAAGGEGTASGFHRLGAAWDAVAAASQ